MANMNITYNSENLCSTPKITKCMNVSERRAQRGEGKNKIYVNKRHG